MTTSENVLVVGGEGTIGKALAERLGEQGFSVIKTTRRRQAVDSDLLFLDLADPNSWRLTQASTAFFLAAETSTELCRKNPKPTHAINVDHTVALAEKLVSQGTRVVFLSTNLVFDGSIPYRNADDETCPRTEYGRQKAEAEKRLRVLGDKVVIVRLTKVLSSENELIRKWRTALSQNQPIHPFLDMVAAPLPLTFVTDVLSRLASENVNGVLQLSGPVDFTYEMIARNLTNLIGADQDLVQPTTSRAAGADIEAIPAHTTLDTSSLEKIPGVPVEPMTSSLQFLL